MKRKRNDTTCLAGRKVATGAVGTASGGMNAVYVLLGILLLGTVLPVGLAYAQLNPMNTVYRINPYEANPAQVGKEVGTRLDIGTKVQWTAINGAPSMQVFTAQHGTGAGRVGLGLKAYSERAGLIVRSSVKASYAYHVPLDFYGDNMLHLGLSVGFLDERVATGRAKGDLSDPRLYAFNQRPVTVDGDFGILVRLKGLEVQASLPNIRTMLKGQERAVADLFRAMAAVSYRVPIGKREGDILVPMAALRNVAGFGQLWDLGTHLELEKLNAGITYHSTGSISLGVGTVYEQRLVINASYTSGTNDLAYASNGEFGISVGYRIKRKK